MKPLISDIESKPLISDIESKEKLFISKEKGCYKVEINNEFYFLKEIYKPIALSISSKVLNLGIHHKYIKEAPDKITWSLDKIKRNCLLSNSLNIKEIIKTFDCKIENGKLLILQEYLEGYKKITKDNIDVCISLINKVIDCGFINLDCTISNFLFNNKLKSIDLDLFQKIEESNNNELLFSIGQLQTFGANKIKGTQERIISFLK